MNIKLWRGRWRLAFFPKHITYASCRLAKDLNWFSDKLLNFNCCLCFIFHALLHILIFTESCRTATVLETDPLQRSMWEALNSYLWLSTVTLLALLDVAIAALLSTIKHLDLGHVVQTHAHTFLQTCCEVLLTAGAEHCWKWIPTIEKGQTQLAD